MTSKLVSIPITGYLLYSPWSFVHHFIGICVFKLGVIVKTRWNRYQMDIFDSCDLKIRQIEFTNDRTNLSCHFKLCTSYYSLLWVQIGVTVYKCPNLGKMFFDLCDPHLWLLALTSFMDITFVNGNYPLTRSDDTIVEPLQKRCYGRRDRRMDRACNRAALLQQKCLIN